MLPLVAFLLAAPAVEVMVPGVPLAEPFAIAFDKNNNWYICEFAGHRILKVDPTGKVTPFAGTGTAGYAGDGGPALKAFLKNPHSMVISPDQQLYVADTLNHRVRKIDLATGMIAAFAGTGEPGFSGDGGPAAKAAFNQPFSVALNPQATRLFVADLKNRRVRAIDIKTGIVTTIAGNGMQGVPADLLAAAYSALVDPRAVAADRAGNVFILEREGNALRMVDPKGRIRTLGIAGLKGPKDVTLDAAGNPIVADAENHLIRQFILKENRALILAGTAQPGAHIDPADPGKTQLNRPHGVYVHADGSLWIADSYNNRILRISTR